MAVFPTHLKLPLRRGWESDSSGGAGAAPAGLLRLRGCGVVYRGWYRAQHQPLLHHNAGNTSWPQREQLRNAGDLQSPRQHHGSSTDPGEDESCPSIPACPPWKYQRGLEWSPHAYIIMELMIVYLIIKEPGNPMFQLKFTTLWDKTKCGGGMLSPWLRPTVYLWYFFSDVVVYERQRYSEQHCIWNASHTAAI